MDKMRFLKNRVLFVLIVVSMLLIFGCAGQKKMVDSRSMEDLPKVTVTVASENLRATAGGSKVGTTAAGDIYPLVNRRGNWCQIHHQELGDIWIWGQSLGFPSVNSIDVRTWLGGKNRLKSVDELKDVFGQPTDVEQVANNAIIYSYRNIQDDGSALFGSKHFRNVDVLIDIATRKVISVDFEMMPYIGKTSEMLVTLGLPQTKSTKTNFDRALYKNKFAGLAHLELYFANSDFGIIGRVVAKRYDSDLWQRRLEITERKISSDKEDLFLEMSMMNNDPTHAFEAPEVDLELHYQGKLLGKWHLGPGSFRIEPGGIGKMQLPIPLKATGINVKEVSARAEITSMIVAPGK
jgi:hypothetical protein